MIGLIALFFLYLFSILIEFVLLSFWSAIKHLKVIIDTNEEDILKGSRRRLAVRHGHIVIAAYF